MGAILIVLHVIFCFTLILVILLQAGRGQGLSGPSFASGNVQSLLGTRAADFLTKATSVAAICFLFTCLALNWIETRKSRSLLDGSRGSAPVSMDEVQKLLEKVKQEVPETAAATAEGVAAEAAAAGTAATSAAAEAANQPVPSAQP